MKQQKQGNGGEGKLPCGHRNVASNIWQALQPNTLAMVTQLLSKAGVPNPPMLGLILHQCKTCKLVVNIQVSATKIEQSGIARLGGGFF